ncbi:MAG TPA: MFS transporter, partial [Spirochaetia bacterium]|nr:MFS transporter [Spirochaetia bacterium]
LLPELAANNGLAMSQMGIIFPAIFAGTVPASLLVGFILDRIGANRIILISIPLLAGSAIGITLSHSVPLLVLFSFLLGAGGGAGVPTANTLIVKLFGRRSVAAVNLLNVFFAIGAIVGPALVSLGLSLFQTGTPVFWFAALIAAACIPYFARAAAGGPPVNFHHSAESAAPGVGAEGGGARPRRLPHAKELFRSPLLWLVGGVLFFDVGTEQTLGGWMAVYMKDSSGIALASAALVVSGFWVAFTAGRLAGAGIGTRLKARSVLLGSFVTAIFGVIIVNVAADRVGASIVGFLLTGLGLGPVYPTTMALIGTLFESRAGTAIGATAALGTIGGMAIPLAEGMMFDLFGPPGAARLILVGVVAIALLSLLLLLSMARRPAHEA